MTEFRQWMELIGTGVDALGVFIVVAGMLIATFRFLRPRREGEVSAYVGYRQDVGKAILLGLEFLVAGDILRTIVVDPTLDNVIVLGLIVLIRTFLSMALELELEGRWPWQATDKPSAD